MRISDWSSDVCSSDLSRNAARQFAPCQPILAMDDCQALAAETVGVKFGNIAHRHQHKASLSLADATGLKTRPQDLSADTQLVRSPRSAERTVGKECVSTCSYGWSPDN